MPKHIAFTFTFLLILGSGITAAQPYKYLVLKGGGIWGIAYCGALKELEEKNVTPGIEKVAGTSVGAIVGSLFSVGFTATETESIMQELDIKAFNDGGWFFIGGEKRLRKKFGWYKGRKLAQWIGGLIEEKTGNENITFLELHQLALKDKKYKDLYVTATNLSKQRLEIFSWETYPNLPVKVAVRASASIPLYYEAVFIDSLGHVADKGDESKGLDVYADGGLLADYPITIFNEKSDSGRINKYTLGLKLERPKQIEYNEQHKGVAPYKIKSFKSYIGAVYNVAMEQLIQSMPYDIEKKNTIYISNGSLSPKVRRISKKQKDELYKNGKEGVEKFFK